MICGPRPTIASVEGIPYNEKREVFLIPGLDPGGAANQDDPKITILGDFSLEVKEGLLLVSPWATGER